MNTLSSKRVALAGSASFDPERFRDEFEHKGAAELSMDAGGNPRLYTWPEGDASTVFGGLDGLGTHSSTVRVVLIRVLPSSDGKHTMNLLMRARYHTGGKRAIAGGAAAGSQTAMLHRFAMDALQALGDSVARAWSGARSVVDLTFYDYFPEVIEDPVAAAAQYVTVLYVDGKVVDLDSTYQIVPTAYSYIQTGSAKYLGVFGIDNTRHTTLLLFDAGAGFHGRVQRHVFENQLVFSAQTQQQESDGRMLYAAEVNGVTTLFEINVSGAWEPKKVDAGDVSTLFKIVGCFGHFVAITKGGRVIHLVRTGSARYKQSVLTRVHPAAIPRAFHMVEASLVLDLASGAISFSNRFDELELRRSAQETLRDVAQRTDAAAADEVTEPPDTTDTEVE